MNETVAPRRAACPICGRPSEPKFRAFCSKRCADVDLGRWLNERYAIPEERDPDAPPPSPDPED